MDVDEHDVTGDPGGRRAAGGFRRVLVWASVALGFMAIGALGATLALRYAGQTAPGLVPVAPTVPRPEVAAARAPGGGQPDGEVEVLLSPEALARIGIKTARASAADASVSIRVPGSVMANAYREVKVTPIAGGIVTRIHVELGTAVRRGAPLATLFSAELADAQTKYLSMTAIVDAAHRKLERTRKLVEIGAASRQELEEVTAVHASHATEVEAARQRLLLLGLHQEQVEVLRTPSQVIADIVVPAPMGGVITGRSANLGQVVGTGQELFVVTDLSEVWVSGDLYEQDFETVQVGSEAALTAPAYPGLTLRGRVTYIDPRVDPQARTAKVRVEVPNVDGRLRLGMYVSILFTTRVAERAVVVPRVAVQTLGERQVVFIPVKDEPGKFIQRSVRIGRLEGDVYTVTSGLRAGEEVVTEGSFFLRAESLRNAPSG